MFNTQIAGALLVLSLTACEIGEPRQTPRVVQAPDQGPPVEAVDVVEAAQEEQPQAVAAGLRSDFKAPC